VQLTCKPVSHLAGTTPLQQNHSREAAATEIKLHYAANDRSNSVYAKLASDLLTCCLFCFDKKKHFLPILNSAARSNQYA